jgi:hypothetical protein
MAPANNRFPEHENDSSALCANYLRKMVQSTSRPKRLHNRERSDVCTSQPASINTWKCDKLDGIGANKYRAANEMPYVPLYLNSLFLKEFFRNPEPSELIPASKSQEELTGIGSPIKNIESFSVTIIVFRVY